MARQGKSTEEIIQALREAKVRIGQANGPLPILPIQFDGT